MIQYWPSKAKRSVLGSKIKAINCRNDALLKIKKEVEHLQKDVHLEILNDHKAKIIHALISIFNIAQWHSHYNIKYKLT